MPRRKPRNLPEFNAEQAAAFGIKVPDMGGERWLSPNQAARVLNITGEAVKQWIYQRRLPAVKLSNGFWRIKVSDFEAFLGKRMTAGNLLVEIMDLRSSPDASIDEMVAEKGYRLLRGQGLTDFVLKAMESQPALFLVILPEDRSEAWAALDRIRAQKSLRNIPMLLLGNTEPDAADAERMSDCGVKGFRKLPVTGKELHNEISAILNRR